MVHTLLTSILTLYSCSKLDGCTCEHYPVMCRRVLKLEVCWYKSKLIIMIAHWTIKAEVSVKLHIHIYWGVERNIIAVCVICCINI